MDPALVADDFNEQDYATLVAHPSPFWNFPKAFLCLVGLSRHYTLDEETYPWILYKNGEEMNIFAFIHTPDPTKVKIVERGRNESEPLWLETTIDRTVLMLLVAPDRAESELEASVERLFDEGGSGNQTEQVDFVGGGKDVNIQSVIKDADTIVEDVAPMQSKRQGLRKSMVVDAGGASHPPKRKSVVVDAGGASHPPKRLKEDYGTPSGTSVSGKSRSALKRLLARAVLNVEVEVATMPTLPFMTSFISSTPEREGKDHTDFATGPNLRAIGSPLRFVISSDSSHHSGTNVAEAEVDSLIMSSIPIVTTVTTITSTVDPALVAKKKLIKPSLFCVDSSLAGGTDPTTGVFLDLTGSDFLFGAIRTIIDPDTDLQKVYFLLREAEAAKVIRLGAEAFIFEAVEKSLRDETDALKERNTILEKERNALDVKVTELEASAVSKERKLTDLNALVTSIKSQNDIFVDRVREPEISSFGLQEKVTVYESCMDQLEKFQDDRMKVVNDKFDKMYNDFIKMALYLEEKFYPRLLTTVSGCKWLLTLGMELAIVKCLNSPEYIFALGADIDKAIKKGMQDGLSAGIVHGKEGRALIDVAAHNPSAEDASVEAVMNILHLEGPLAEKLGLNELQPNVDQLMVLIHCSPDKVVLGATALSLSLEVSSFRVRRIKENIANQRSALRDVFVPLAEPFSAAALTGTAGNSDTAHATADTNIALSTTFASSSSIEPISIDDYEVVGAEAQAVADENAVFFPNVDGVELNIPE
uniref:Transposase (Putative), gypsy type n=1 Tax=Tanacetum cinerariifolium TaxID=118510 RepID=A0A6L2JQU4_TANCI|nr:hypothetical protein [Tanacetum cinerariifolium]